jgi:hypothetical protein
MTQILEERITETPRNKTKNPNRVVRHPEIDRLIQQRQYLTLKKMGEMVGFTKPRQGAWEYLKRTQQLGPWKESEKITETRTKKYIGELINTIVKRKDNLILEMPWSPQKALLQYILELKKPPRKHSYETVLTFFERYERARNRNEKLSLEELCKGLNMSTQSAGNMLKVVGLEPMYGAWRITPKEKREAMQRGFNLEMSPQDIAHFLELPWCIVRYTFSRIGTRPRFKSLMISGSLKERKHLSYRLASRIYQAQDLDFTRDEITQLCDTNEEIVNHAIGNRSIYGRQIVEALRVLYNNNSINKPYLLKN